MHRGYVKLYRRALANGWLKDHPVWVMMSYCLLKANHQQAVDVIRSDRVDLAPGQFIYGRNTAASETALSPQQIRTAMRKLEKYDFLTIRATKRFSVVTVCNWGGYQVDEKPEQPSEQPTANQELTKSQPTANHKQECKNEKNDKKKSKSARFEKPTIEQVTEYCRARAKGIDPQTWMDYYTSNGWRVGKNPMKDWKAAVRTWEKNGYNQPTQTSANKYQECFSQPTGDAQ